MFIYMYACLYLLNVLSLPDDILCVNMRANDLFPLISVFADLVRIMHACDYIARVCVRYYSLFVRLYACVCMFLYAFVCEFV